MNSLFESKYSASTPLLQISFCARFLTVLIFQFMSRCNVGHGVKMKRLSKDEITAATLMLHNSKNSTLGTHIYGQ